MFSPPSIHGIRLRNLRHSAVALFCLFSAAVSFASISLDIQPNRTQIYLGESLLLNVTVNGSDDAQSVPDLSALRADVRLLGSQSQSQHMIQIINGRMTRSDNQARLFAFQVKPATSGAFATGPITLRTSQQLISEHGPEIQVVGQERQDLVIATMAASRESVLVDEPFTITLSVSIAALAAPNNKFEPLNPSQPPRIECDCLSQAEIPGLRTPNIQKELQERVSNDPRTAAFEINDYQMQQPNLFSDPFANMDPFRPHPVRFRLTPTSAKINDRTYFEYKIPLTYTPTQEGDYTFGPLAFKGLIITGADATGHAITRNISCVGPAVTVRVVPPPETNRPDCFIGSVGSNLQIHAELDASICKVGDPLTLTVELTGPVSLGNMRPPQLNLQSDLTTDFRIYDDNVEASAIPSGKRFRYRIRPIHEGTLELAPVQVSWFDIATRAYRIARSEPIPVQARANTQLISDNTNGTPHQLRLSVERTATAPAAITLADGTHTTPLLPPALRLLSLFLAGPLIFVLWITTQQMFRITPRLKDAYRRNHALPHALAALHAARLANKPDAATIGAVIRTYLSTRLQIAGSSLTSAEAERLLLARGVPPLLATACSAQLAQLDQALYRPDSPVDEPARVLDHVLELLPQLAAALDHPTARPEDDA